MKKIDEIIKSLEKDISQQMEALSEEGKSNVMPLIRLMQEAKKTDINNSDSGSRLESFLEQAKNMAKEIKVKDAS